MRAWRFVGLAVALAAVSGCMAVSVPPAWGQVAPDGTRTVVGCSPNPVRVGGASVCTVTVTDTAASPSTPTGSVNFGVSGSGVFGAGSCVLTGSGSSASCAVSYRPTAAGSAVISAAYGGDGTHMASSGSTAVTVPVTVTTHQILVLLLSDTTSSTKDRITKLLRSGGVTFSFRAVAAGIATIAWYQAPTGPHLASRRRPVLVASGRLVFPSAGTRHMRLKLTAAGKKLLRHAKQINLIAKGTFKPPSRPAVTARKTFMLAR